MLVTTRRRTDLAVDVDVDVIDRDARRSVAVDLQGAQCAALKRLIDGLAGELRATAPRSPRY